MNSEPGTSALTFQTPPAACDCHIHVFDRRFPVPGIDPRTTPNAPASAYQAVQRALGLERSVVVQANGYGPDNRCMLEAIKVLGPTQARGVAVVKSDATMKLLSELADQGVCGIRFHMLPGGYLTWDALDGLGARAAELGWHLQLQMDGRDLPERVDQLERVPCPLVIDHVGKFLEPVTVDHPGFRSLLRLLDRSSVWVKLSAPYEVSKSGPPNYEDVGILARNLVQHAPQRMLWASNWPHPWFERPPSNEHLLSLLAEWAPDPTIRTMILVDNPDKLYGFSRVPV